MLKWSEVENLSDDHPLMIQFMKEQEELDAAYALADVDENYEEDCEEDEESLEYFNHYVAGDR